MMQAANGQDWPGSGDSAGGEGLRQFVNHLTVHLSLAEIRFDLGLLGARPLDASPVWRFVTTPDHMQSMHHDMARALASYRARYGEIRSTAADDTPGDGGADG
jgi:hypothetical protein